MQNFIKKIVFLLCVLAYCPLDFAASINNHILIDRSIKKTKNIKTKVLTPTSYLVNHTKAWLKTVIVGSLSHDKKMKYYLEPEIHLVDSRTKFEETVDYFGLGYEVKSNLLLFMGYAPVVTQKNNRVTTGEMRIWQQINWVVFDNQTIKFSNRTRIEERKNLIEDPAVALRVREKFIFLIPIKNCKDYSLLLFNESFFNLNHPKWVSNALYSENQGFIGFEKQLNKVWNVDVGYMNQFQATHPRQMSNVLYLVLNGKF